MLARMALRGLSLKKVLWVLTLFPPHKRDQPITPVQHRLDMLKASISSDPEFQLSRVDMERPAPHYALDTVRLLRKQYPHAKLVYLMGGDSLHDLPSWHMPEAFVGVCDALGVMRRPGAVFDMQQLSEMIPGLAGKVQFFDAPEMDIAARTIRQRIRAGLSVADLVPEDVHTIIQQRLLYR